MKSAKTEHPENTKLWIYQRVSYGKSATANRLIADVLSVSPSSERIRKLWVELGFIWRALELRYL